MPKSWRAGLWSLAMEWWALFSAMFWLCVAVALADAVGTPNTIIGMVASTVTYGAFNLVLSLRLFGMLGSALQP